MTEYYILFIVAFLFIVVFIMYVNNEKALGTSKCETESKFCIDLIKKNGITFNPKTELTMFDSPYLLEASSSSGLPVTFSSSPSNACTVNGNVLTLISASRGSCMVTASAGGYPLYVNTKKTVEVAVSLVNQTITLTGTMPEKIRYSGSGETYNILFATASSGLTTR